MYTVGLHSALAIKRQRKRRDEQRRARERRYSAQSGESGLTSPRASTGSLDHHPRHHHAAQVHRAAGEGVLDSKVVTSVGMLHIGVVFLVLGAFLLASGLLPGDMASWSSKSSGGWWNELVATGIFASVMGIFLIVLNKVIAKKEEDDLEEYVQRQLTRSRSGHRLERDVETGGLTTRHARRAKQLKAVVSSGTLSVDETEPNVDGSPPRSPPPAYSPPPASAADPQPQPAHLLEQITEEDGNNDRIETSTTPSLSPGSPCDTRELIHPDATFCNLNGNHPQAHRPLYVHVSRI
ncbi:uncharacterized protein [Neodiprion pinetum]|uniref:Uncharacterized protein LOC107219096 n=1 Tax=Neodiprion lecontei TaxID=441921 RepID=A0A6J0BCN6_NEOLC|nr:uncharacterized protein LOC107219096 [Neodiprion lecontei]XP_046427881.1 uncharacterized protein LOC124183433 [Neodiprion fabricii]XP_046427882.1 uncharacterized protein LOC124183433 [Neodiprion fabricii]XP_046484525.1 uncharacterized protein LOC124220108 [Neodiprion pinetum]XP_046621686.1 uncharacterized protein LOC124305834 [Neodiprion virginianus]XP_046621688.1 uncharacterized protein LOC124305834 [Neodiprion virginianus]